MATLEEIRREYAEKIGALVGLRSAGLLRGFSVVPREEFLGPGPWQIVRIAELARGYVTTPDADPRHVYDNVLVSLDDRRHLNNGEPAALARWLDDLDLAAGSRFLHVGCGVGYYTAIAAEAIGPGGTVVGVEIDPVLAERAGRNLRRWSHARVAPPGSDAMPRASFDAILVNAGATEVLPIWLDALAPGGRLLVPLTLAAPQPDVGVGHMLRVGRTSGGHAARFVSPVGIFHCAGARTEGGEALLREAHRRGACEAVRSLRRDAHAPEPDCWLHAARFCLSQRAPGP